MNSGPIWRLTPGEVQSPAKPECCEALWEDKSNPTTNAGLDPILWTDQKTGRTLLEFNGGRERCLWIHRCGNALQRR